MSDPVSGRSPQTLSCCATKVKADFNEVPALAAAFAGVERLMINRWVRRHHSFQQRRIRMKSPDRELAFIQGNTDFRRNTCFW